MIKKINIFTFVLIGMLLVSSCDLLEDAQTESTVEGDVTPINELTQTDNFRPGSLEHILEGELNRQGKAVGYHYDHLPSKKGEIVEGTKTEPNQEGVYEAEVSVEGVHKESNRGRSSFFPDNYDTQEIVDAINEVYEDRTFISGNTYEGLTSEGMLIRMYIDEQERIISAFPVY